MRPSILTPPAGIASEEPSRLAPSNPDEAPGQHPTAPPIVASRHRSIEQLRAEGGYSDRAKLAAQAHEDRCRRPDQWVTWPKVSTTVDDLGWGGTDHGGRKKVERGNRELAEGGELVRLRLGGLIRWFDEHGPALGLAWPKELVRVRKGSWVTVLLWRIPEAAGLAQCDRSVAFSQDGQDRKPAECRIESDESVGSNPTDVSHPTLNVRTEPPKERTSDDSAVAPGGEEPAMTTTCTRRERAAELYREIEGRGMHLVLGYRDDGAEGFKVRRMPGSDAKVEPAEAAELVDLRDEVLRLVKVGGPPKRGPASAGPEAAEPAPKVDPEAAERFLAMANQLPGHRDPKAAEAAGLALCEALSDSKEATEAAFVGYCDRVRRKVVGLAVLDRAYRLASGPDAGDRGRTMVWAWGMFGGKD